MAMKVSYNWLKDYVDVSLSPQELGAALTGRGVTVETIKTLNPGVEGVVVGRVIEIERHPKADTLWVCQVDVGAEKRLQILTGAQNVKRGDLVPVAVPGSKIPGKVMAVAELRGMQSHGMLCSPDELGIDEGGDGILILPQDDELQLGVDAAEILGLNDHVLELDLTNNYDSHCQAMIGVAQEVAALLETSTYLPEVYTQETPNTDADKMISITIADPELCARYTARIVRGARVGPSPAWLQARVRAAGMRPINNIVDISNFVMIELGQPLHTFDYAKIAGKQIIVRRAQSLEPFQTLDGQLRTLEPEQLIIADQKGPVAIAGVMGGLDSEVTDATVDILIESAIFDNINNRRTAMKLNLVSEASRRFTKGVDPSGCIRAADRAAQLIALLAGGTVIRGHVDNYPRPTAPPIRVLRTAKVNNHLGLALSTERMSEHLNNLGLIVMEPGDLVVDLACGKPDPELEIGDDLSGRPVWTALHQVSPVPTDAEAYRGWAEAAWASVEAAGQALERIEDQEALVVVIPTRRLDLFYGEIDLVEEIARSEGYDAIPPVLPVLATARGGRRPMAERVLQARRTLAGAGLVEVITHSLVHPRIYDKLGLPADSDQRSYLTLANPMYEERSTLRTTLLAGLLDTLQHNVNRQTRDLQIFEISQVYQPKAGEQLPEEPRMLAIAMMGNLAPKAWNSPDQPADFFALKGAIEHLLHAMNVTGWSVERSVHVLFHPGRQASLMVGGRRAGIFGELHPTVQATWDLPSPVYVAELDFETLVAGARPQRDYRQVTRFPAISRDLAMVVSQDLASSTIAAAIQTAGGDLVEDVALFDLYQGGHVQAGQRSLAYSITYRAADRTLTDADIERAHGRIRHGLQELGAELRS